MKRTTMMLRISFLNSFFAALIVTSTWANAAETVTLLDRGEPYDSMVADGDVLWIGQSRLQFNANYRLEAYQPNGTLIDRVTLSHSLNSMKVAGNGSIIITGISPESRLTQYTLARLENGKIKKTTNEIALGGFITFWVSTVNGRHFFTDMGGNPNDTSDPAAGLPAQTIFSSTGTDSKYLAARVRMPVSGTSLNGKLLLVSSEGMGQDASSIVEVDPKTSATRVITKSKAAKYRGIAVLPGTSQIVTSALSESKVRVIDTVSGETRHEFKTKGYPRSFVITGHCVVVGNDESNVVEVFDLNGEASLPMFADEINMGADEFSGIKSIVIDDKTSTVFARAANACNPILEPCDKENNRVVKLDQSFSDRIQSSCK